jgi:hypothetical protein
MPDRLAQESIVNTFEEGGQGQWNTHASGPLVAMADGAMRGIELTAIRRGLQHTGRKHEYYY